MCSFLSMSNNNKKDCECSCSLTPVNRSVCQTLTEMDWERGIWNSALNGELDRVEGILLKSKNPKCAANEVDNSGYTALHYAARNGHVEVCRMLLQHGADIEAQTKSGKVTPLQKAAVGGKVGAVKLLLQHGANIQSQDSDGQTALHKAASNNHSEIVSILLQACPDLASVRDNRGNVAICDGPTM